MADEKPQELLIIKRVRGGSEAGHGGAWKIAFADFMTAMMALFLVLWLISATNEKTKSSVARYFNPVKLVAMTIQKRGLNDPKEHPNEDASDNAPPPSQGKGASKPEGKNAAKQKDLKPQSKADKAAPQPTHSEAALFRDPYAVLAEIAASGAAVKTPLATPINAAHPNVGAAARFQDPFQTAAPEVPRPQPQQQPQPAAQPAVSASVIAKPPGGSGAAPATSVPAPQLPTKVLEKVNRPPPPVTVANLSQKDGAPSTAKSLPASDTNSQMNSQTADQAKGLAKGIAANNAEVARLRQKIAGIVGKGAAAPDIEVRSTQKGIVISLTDGFDYAMFAIGSAEPQRQTLQIMEKIAHILKNEKGSIIISGDTDGRRYKSRTYDNWRLSTARAQMALYMLVRGGLDEKRIERIQGEADRDLKVPDDPMAAQNRRIEILLREPKS